MNTYKQIVLPFLILWSTFSFSQEHTSIEYIGQLASVESLLDAAQYHQADSLLRSILPKIVDLNDPILIAKGLHLKAYIALEQGDYPKAHAVFQQALQQTKQFFTRDHPLISQAHNDLGRYFFVTGQLDSAQYHHQIALDIRLKNFGSVHTKVADSYNNLGNIFQTSGQSSKALSYYQKVLHIRQQREENQSIAIASTLNNLGNAYLSLGQLAKATQTFRRSLYIRKQLLSEKHPQYGRSLQNLGNTFFQAEQLDSAQYYYQKALENVQLNYDTTHPNLAALFENLGNCALKQSQASLAEEWHQKALLIRNALVEVNPIAPASSYLYLGDVQRQKGDFLQAMRLTEKGCSILQAHLSPTDPYLADAWEKVGLCQQALGYFIEAREAYTSALDIRWQVLGGKHPSVAGIYTNLGNLYWQQSDQNSAIYYYQEALAIWQQFGPQFAKEQADLHSNIGNSFLKQKAWPQALASYQRALAILDGSSVSLQATLWQQIGLAYDGMHRYQNALGAYQKAIEHTGDSYEWQQKLFMLGARANTLLHIYQQGKSQDTLHLAASDFSESLRLLAQQRLAVLHPESKQKVLALHYDLFAGAIEAQLARWNLEKDSTALWRAFQLSEESKGLRLREKWLDNSKDGALGSDSVAEFSLAKILHTDEASAQALDYQLQGKRGLLAFFSGSEYLYWFFMKDERLEAGKIENIQDINELVAGFGESITQFPVASSSQKISLDSFYQVYAQALYQQVWQKIAPKFSGATELVIVPDGALAYLPFAALLTTKPSKSMRYRSYPFLLHDYQISYAYSAALLAKAIQQPTRKASFNCLAFAPTFEGHQPALAPLAFNTIEVEGLKENFKAEAITGDEASLTHFLSIAPKYRILHLATHGVANIYRSEFSYLAFSIPDAQTNGRLYVKDLYQLDIPAELVVMSACESGVGRYQAGEGAISLGRSFAAAGARSIISTLWNVNDAKTADFMLAFYEQLERKTSKDAAIRKVQQQYLQISSQEDAHPFYWAAYLPIGDMTALKIGDKWSNMWIIGLSTLLLFLLFLGFKSGLLKNFSK